MDRTALTGLTTNREMVGLLVVEPVRAVSIGTTMGTLLSGDKDGQPPAEHSVCSALYVHGVRYDNTAAKFWPTLIDETLEEFPECTSIELTAPVAGRLRQRYLHPEKEFEQDLLNMLTTDLQQVIRETMAQLEILGPPSAVAVRLLQDDTELLSGELPTDCIDADIFPYLIVWPLLWAGIPESQWINEFVSGSLQGNDKQRGLVYTMHFALRSRHLSEELYDTSLQIQPSVTALV
jgi:hypothetical protein